MKRIIIFMALITSLWGCNPYDVTELLLSRNNVSLTYKGVEEFAYIPESYQIGYNDHTHTFYVYEDRLADWLSVVCDTDPSTEGQQVSADVSWTTKTSIRSLNDLTFKVEKIDEDGHIWLWNSTHIIGIVIKKP